MARRTRALGMFSPEWKRQLRVRLHAERARFPPLDAVTRDTVLVAREVGQLATMRIGVTVRAALVRRSTPRVIVRRAVALLAGDPDVPTLERVGGEIVVELLAIDRAEGCRGVTAGALPTQATPVDVLVAGVALRVGQRWEDPLARGELDLHPLPVTLLARQLPMLAGQWIAGLRVIEGMSFLPSGARVAGAARLAEPVAMHVHVARGAFGLETDEAVRFSALRGHADRFGHLKSALVAVLALQPRVRSRQSPPGLPVVELPGCTSGEAHQLVIGTAVLRVTVGALLMVGLPVQATLSIGQPPDLDVALLAADRHRSRASPVALETVERPVELAMGLGERPRADLRVGGRERARQEREE